MPFRSKQPLDIPFIEAAHEIVRVDKETYVEISERSSFEPPSLDPVENFDLFNQVKAGVPLKKVACTKQEIPNFVADFKEN